MSNENSNTFTNSYSIIKLTAFWGIIISGISSLTTLIIRSLIAANIIEGAGATVNTVIGIMNLIANLALFISVFLAAYAHSKGKAKVWKIMFWVFSVLSLLSILGFNVLGMFF